MSEIARQFTVYPVIDSATIRDMTAPRAKREIGFAMIMNLHTLVPSSDTIDWSQILPFIATAHYMSSPDESTEMYANTGARAIQEVYATDLGSTASGMEWDMHSPEMIYISGAFFARVLDREIQAIDRITADPDRIYPSEEVRKQVFASYEAKRSMLEEHEQQLTASMREFAYQNIVPLLPLSLRDYADILYDMALTSQTGAIRDSLYKAFKQGDVDKVRYQLGKPRPKGRRWF